MTNPIIPTLVCIRCGHVWIPNVPKPQKCPRCLSSYWNRPRVEGTEKQKQQPSITTTKPEFEDLRTKLQISEFDEMKRRLGK